MKGMVDKILKGDIYSIARLITLVEDNDPKATEAMKEIHMYTGKAHVIGVTGVTGSGKSTLICELTKFYREQGKKIGIIAIDPTSPFSGGALLGDRIRMNKLAIDKDVFIRSMGTRGTLGGLASAVYDVIEILDASGKDIIIVETVGVGQAEVDVVKVADTIIVIVVPGLGDSIQTLKAGIMEIADIFVVNKADREGVNQTIAEIENLVDITCANRDRKTPIVKTIAKEGMGIKLLASEIEKHLNYIKENDLFEKHRRFRYESELVEIVKKRLINLIFDESLLKEKINILLDKICKKDTDPHSAAEEILKKILK